jgi:LmbE family N-acetylglucosaminyl deacetylase
MKKKNLIIAAHPDDESFGMAGTIIKKSNKEDFYVVFLSDGERGRYKIGQYNKTIVTERYKKATKASKLLGIKKNFYLNFIDQRLDSISSLDIIQKLEEIIKTIKPSIVYTHFGNDLNQDHRVCFDCACVAIRPYRRSYIKKIMTFEVPSSSGVYPSNSFHPNFYTRISNKEFKRKIQAIKIYGKEVDAGDTPRSIKKITSLMSYRGSTINAEYAEAFQIIFECED